MYQVLARKYRPKNFHELIGQSHVSTALTNAIDHQRLHHAYLFTGTRGVGKTTIARILAKCLNCETGVTSEPCGVCSTCVAIDAGRFIDLIEIDAASRTKVEDTRELLDNVPYAPTQGRYKVYLIDEVHMLSTHSFNALLKTLEEPPEHVKFLLATTDPQKLPITIISRCLQFVLRPIAQTVLADYLAQVLQQEQINAAPDALWQLASSAKGSVRDALSLTDQAIAFGNGQIATLTVKQMLGLIDQTDVAALLLAISTQNTAAVGQIIAQLREQVVDAKAVFDSLVEILHEVALLQILPSFELPLNSQQQQLRHQLAAQLSADIIQLYYEILVHSREKIALANTPLQALEMAILRLLAFRPLAMNQRPQRVEVLDSVESLPTIEQSEETTDVQPITDPVMAENFTETPTIMQNGEINLAAIENTENLSLTNPIVTNAVELPTNLPAELAGSNLAGSDIDVSSANPTDDVPQIQENNTLTHDSPLALLIPPPQDLTGQWTPEKWDYWVYQARENNWLMQDELVLAKRGTMVGEMTGQSEFLTSEQILSNSNTFVDFQRQLAVHFPHMQVRLTAITDSEILSQLPEQQQAQRENQALLVAKQQLSQTPVMQALLQENARLDYIRLAK